MGSFVYIWNIVNKIEHNRIFNIISKYYNLSRMVAMPSGKYFLEVMI